MLKALIISKDRACQLQLLLESMKKHAPNLFDVTINYTFSNPSFKDGYEQLKKRHIYPNIHWVKETNIHDDFMSSLKASKQDQVCILTDDTVFFRRVNITPFELSDVMNGKVLQFSFRLGLNTVVQDYRTGSRQPPLFGYEKHENEIIKWNWTEYYKNNNYGYCIGMDGCVFNVSDLITISESFHWSGFRGWEGTIAGDLRHTLQHKPFMAAFEHSVVVNIPTNNVQPGLYAGDKYPISLDELNTKYLAGNTLSLDKMDFSNIIGAHQEVELKWTE